MLKISIATTIATTMTNHSNSIRRPSLALQPPIDASAIQYHCQSGGNSYNPVGKSEQQRGVFVPKNRLRALVLVQLPAMDFSKEQQALVLNVTRGFIRAALESRDLVCPENLDPILDAPAGCFVSLHRLDDHRLRGCVGRIDSSQPLVEALRSSAAHAVRDPRFAGNPIRVEELSLLELEVSVLSPPRPAPHALGFDPPNDGIYLMIGDRSGCFLPQVARETGWTREQLLDRLCLEKLGLPAGTWRHPQARLHLFSVVVIGPEMFDPQAGQVLRSTWGEHDLAI